MVRGYGSNAEEKRVEVSQIINKPVLESITNSNCQDQYRCNQICDNYGECFAGSVCMSVYRTTCVCTFMCECVLIVCEHVFGLYDFSSSMSSILRT